MDIFVTQMGIKSVTMKYGGLETVGEKTISDKNDVEEFEKILGAARIRRVDKPLFTMPGKQKAYSLVIDAKDIVYTIDFLNDKKFQLSYNLDGKPNIETYKVLRGLDREKMFEVFGVEDVWFI